MGKYTDLVERTLDEKFVTGIDELLARLNDSEQGNPWSINFDDGELYYDGKPVEIGKHSKQDRRTIADIQKMWKKGN